MISASLLVLIVCIYYACMQIRVCVCVYSVKNALVFVNKSANEFTMRKSAKSLSVVVPQWSAVLLRVRSPSCPSYSSCKIKRVLISILFLSFMKVSRFSDSYHGF